MKTTHQKKYVFSIHFSMAPEGLAALAASDEDLDSRTPVARLVPAAEGGYKEGTGIRGGGKIQKKIAAFWECS